MMAFVLMTFMGSFTPSLSAAEIPSPLKKIESKYASAKSLEAIFFQNTFSKLTNSKKETTGVITLKIPDKFRWETLNPGKDKNLFVSDGRKFWSYTPPFMDGEKGQVLEKKTSEIQSQLATQLLSGAFSKIKDAKFETVSDDVFRLVPKKGTAGTIEKIELSVNSKQALVEKVKLIHDNGNESEVKLSAIKFGEKFEDAYFRFAVPSGVEVIRE